MRIIGALIVAALAWSATSGLLMLLPPNFAVVALFVGLVLFLIGAELHWRWPLLIGGILMFGGVFAAALLGALG
jgi:hypothetical protein